MTYQGQDAWIGRIANRFGYYFQYIKTVHYLGQAMSEGEIAAYYHELQESDPADIAAHIRWRKKIDKFWKTDYDNLKKVVERTRPHLIVADVSLPSLLP